MDYTKKCKDSIWTLDADSDDISQVMSVLDNEFRTFGEALLSIMQKKLGVSIEDPIEVLKQCCQTNKVPISEIGSAGTLKNWFSGKPRPKKGEESRHKMFVLAFALHLDISETTELFHKAYLDRAFNPRNYRELIYYFCIDRDIDFHTAESLINQVCFEQSVDSDTTIMTSQLLIDSDNLAEAGDLVSYIQGHPYNFAIQNYAAKQIVGTLKDKARKYAQAQAKALQAQRKSDIDAIKEEAEREWRDYYFSMDINSDSFLYSTITGQRVNGKSGKSGTLTLPISGTEFPREIKNNFPQVKSLSASVDSYEELRKVIILLFSYVFWYEIKMLGEEDSYYDQYIAELEMKLNEANLPPVYHGNPYDWLFMYCTTSANPLDTFQCILANALERDDD